MTPCDAPGTGWPKDSLGALTCPCTCRECPGWTENVRNILIAEEPPPRSSNPPSNTPSLSICRRFDCVCFASLQADPVSMWTFVLWWSVISPVGIWFLLPFIRGEGDINTRFNLFKCGFGRLQDCILPGEGDKPLDHLMPPAHLKADGGASRAQTEVKMLGDYLSPSFDTALPAKLNEVLTVLEMSPCGEWLLVRNDAGNEGWVPRHGVADNMGGKGTIAGTYGGAGYTPPTIGSNNPLGDAVEFQGAAQRTNSSIAVSNKG